MKKTGVKLLVSLFGFLMVFGIFTQVVKAAETDGAVEEEMITVSFYDSDGATLLLSVDIPDDGEVHYLCDYISDIGEIDLTRRGYEIYRWYYAEKDKNYTPERLYNDFGMKKDYVFVAKWREKPREFGINYQLNSGEFSKELENIPYDFTVESDAISLPNPQRKNHVFDGWYTDEAFTRPIENIPAGTYVDSVEYGVVPAYTVYAKWISCTPGKIAAPTAKYVSKGKIKVSFAKEANADGYEITYAADKQFKKDKITEDLGNKTSLTMTNLLKKTYYFKVRAYKTDSTGNRCYGKYSAVSSVKVKKGVKEYTAKKNSGKLKSVKVLNGTDLYVSAKISKRLKSSDSFYYLVKVDPNNNKVLKQIAKKYKTSTVTFRLPLKEDNGTNHVQGKYGIAVKKGKSYMLISSAAFISNPEAAAAYTAAFPVPTSKKGRQGCYDESLGDKNYFINYTINRVIGTKSDHSVKYKYNGKTYYFNTPGFGDLSSINEDGGTVTVQLMLQYDSRCKDLILPSGRKSGANYYAFNTENKAAREKIEAVFHFLAEYASREGYHVDNWILGNEVNTYANMNGKWYYAGDISRSKFIENYASTFRMLYYAVKSNNQNGRVYICCDHTWINRENDWGTKYFTKAFDEEIKSQNKKIQWNLAYHAYSAVLTNADFWNDGSLAPHNLNADFVTPNNLEILTDYIEDNFGKNVRIILSEQGFSCSGGVGSPYNVGRQTGESVQAAAVAYLYYKAQFNDMIDAVIFSAGDHGGAGFQFDFIGRKAENVYKYMDTPKYSKYTNTYLDTIGKSSWKSAVDGFSDKVLQKMPTR